MVFSCFGSGRQSWQLQASKASFLAGSESDVRHWHRGLGRGRGPQARSVPQRLAVWLWRMRRFGSDSYSFLVSSESDVRHWGPWPAGPVRPSGPCCFGVAKVPFVKLGGWKTASFLVGSECNVRHWGPWQEVITSSKGKKQETRNKKQEARNKKPGSNKKNKKTKKTKKKKIRPSLLVGSESDVWLSGLAWS